MANQVMDEARKRADEKDSESDSAFMEKRVEIERLSEEIRGLSDRKMDLRASIDQVMVHLENAKGVIS